MKKDALKSGEEIRKRIASHGAVVMLDFDGTLVEFKPKPEQVRMRARMRKALTACSRRFPVAIITGRAISAVRKHVPIRSISYAGNHGLEWRIRGKNGVAVSNAATSRALAHARKSLTAFVKRNPSTWLEDKKHSLCLHYRDTPRLQEKRIVREVHSLIREAGDSRLRIVGGESIFNIIPNVGYNKGTAARMMFARLSQDRRASPIFIGDDVTDEDAFRAFKRGITVHVKNGKRARTAARYFLKDSSEVERFLKFLSRV